MNDFNMLNRILGALTELAGYRPEKKVSPHTVSKHAEGSAKKKKDWRVHKIIRRKIAEASRKRNRK